MNWLGTLVATSFYVLSSLVVSATTHYVALNSSSATPPYLGWGTAATNIQDAIDAANPGDLVLVSNGVYSTGGRAVNVAVNRVVDTNGVSVQSVNGPAATIVEGYQVPGAILGGSAVRCVYLGAGSALSGFTIRHGATPFDDHPEYESGGGVLCDTSSIVISNCVFDSNAAHFYGGGLSGGTVFNCTFINNQTALSGAGHGGAASGSTLTSCILSNNVGNAGAGAYSCTISNCLVISNSASGWGGGVDIGTVFNCTVVGNSAPTGGGMFQSTAWNSIIYDNSAPSGGPNYYSGNIAYCCTTPLAAGEGNITNQPLFVDQFSGNFRLQTNSSCVNSGTNFYAAGTTDLDGRPRIVGGTVDIGAYELEPDISGAFIGWLQQYGVPSDGSADYTDTDGDGMNNWQEWRCGTDPTNALSVLLLLPPVGNSLGVTVTWESVSTRNYFLERATDLAAPTSFLPLATNVLGQSGITTFNDTNAAGVGPFFYRVGVQ